VAEVDAKLREVRAEAQCAHWRQIGCPLGGFLAHLNKQCRLGKFLV